MLVIARPSVYDCEPLQVPYKIIVFVQNRNMRENLPQAYN